jgi:exodeoxyribonuclease-1
MLEAIARALAAWAPATVLGYNTIRFDEEMLRHAFFTHALPPYATQLGGHRRADLLTMVRAVAMVEPGAITVPLDAAGQPSFKLGAICRANGIVLGEDEAHDALADARATLGLFRRLREAAPSTVALMLSNTEKGSVNRRLAAGEILLLGGGAQPSPVVGVTMHPTVATSWAVVDLTLDPAGYLDADDDGVARLLTGPGPRPIKLVRSNA